MVWGQSGSNKGIGLSETEIYDPQQCFTFFDKERSDKPQTN